MTRSAAQHRLLTATLIVGCNLDCGFAELVRQNVRVEYLSASHPIAHKAAAYLQESGHFVDPPAAVEHQITPASFSSFN